LVDESARRQGVGRALLDAVLKDMRKRGEERVVLHSAVQNKAAHKLFEAVGFRKTMLEMTCEL
jgi:ribosomal protein S18 acetylase RimI-like enzyme